MERRLMTKWYQQPPTFCHGLLSTTLSRSPKITNPSPHQCQRKLINVREISSDAVRPATPSAVSQPPPIFALSISTSILLERKPWPWPGRNSRLGPVPSDSSIEPYSSKATETSGHHMRATQCNARSFIPGPSAHLEEIPKQRPAPKPQEHLQYNA